MAKRRSCLVTIVVVGVLVCGCFLLVQRQKRAQQEEFARQLRLANSEGLPTNAEEFEALIPRAKPEDNAALLYRKLASSAEELRNAISGMFASEVVQHPTKANLSKVRSLLVQFKSELKLIDEGSSRPRCWFDRDWSQGCLLLYPETRQLIDAARLLSVRGALAAGEGRSEDAIGDARRIMRIAGHVGEEPITTALRAQQIIYGIAVRQLAICSFKFRTSPEYADALKSAIDSLPKVNFKKGFTGELFMNLSVTDYMMAGRWKELGFKDDDRRPLDNLMPYVYDQQAARLELVKASRDMWVAFDAPMPDRYALMAAAQKRIDKANKAFIMRELQVSSPTPEEADQHWEAKRLQYTALYRALLLPAIPRTLDTSDLLSPFDGEPLKYIFNGKQIKIEATGKPYVQVMLKLPT